MLLHVEYPRILNILKIFKILEVEVLWYMLFFVTVATSNFIDHWLQKRQKDTQR